MATLQYKYDLDMGPGRRFPTIVKLSQYDEDFELVFRLHSEDGTLDVRNGTVGTVVHVTTAEIRGTKSDGNGYSATCDVGADIDGTPTVTFVSKAHISVDGDKHAQQMTAVAGKTPFELTLYHSETEDGETTTRIVSTGNFLLEVERAPLDLDTLPSDSKIRELYEIDGHIDEIIDAARTILNAIDPTLSVQGAAAEAAETGRRISTLIADLEGISGLPQLPYTIGSNGKWTTVNSYHISVPINGGDVVVFTANASYDGVCAFLKSDNAAAGVTADFCDDAGGATWTERKRVTKNTTVTYTAPSDCNILYVAAKPSNDNNLLPAKLIINGKDITVNLHEAISEHDAEITTLIKKADTTEAESLANRRNLDIWGIRAMTDGEFAPVALPSEFTYLSGYDLPLYTDGYKYTHKIDLSAYKNNSTNTVTDHNNSELQTALTNATAGDTIILDGGCYASIVVDKSINLIGKNNPLFVNYLPGQFTTTTNSNTFKTVADFGYSATMILDITRLDDGVVIPMTQAGSISACVSTPGSYIVSSNKLYVHMYEGRMPTERDIAVLGTNTQTIRLSGASAACKWYLEGLTVFGGKSCIFAFDSEDYGDQTVIGVDCKAYYSQTSDCIAMRGVDAFFQRCETMGAYLDGFNYHKRNPSDSTDNNISNGFEVDCIGHDNGKRQETAAPSNNGSTIHDGGKIVRINGLYYNNNGGNVADASPNTESYNYGCVTFDSKAPYDNADETSADFWARYANMHLYGCRALGDSQYNLRTFSAGTIYVDSKSEYDANKTTGNIVEI